VLEWRYGEQLAWRLVLVGLTESAQQYVDRGYTPLRGALGALRFRQRYGMPFAAVPKPRVSATARACRAVVATRLRHPGREWAAFRALQLANFTSGLVLDDDQGLLETLRGVAGIDAEEVIAALDSPEVSEAYQSDRDQTRRAAGTAAELQGKTAQTDGPVRFTAPSLVFERDGRQLVAGGFQPVEAYDVLICNLDPTLSRKAPPDSPEPLLERFPEGLVTQEVAALLARGNDSPDRAGAEAALIELLAQGRARRLALGDDALWLAA
jgi:2-hydroxychromene-2-carboxylate isomerase